MAIGDLAAAWSLPRPVVEILERLPASCHPLDALRTAVSAAAAWVAPDLCTSLFAVGRVAARCAHALEQFADNRLIRPRAEYVGPAPRALAGRAAGA